MIDKRKDAPMNARKTAVAFSFSLLAASLSADTMVFPSNSGDLASAEAWGGTLPGETDTVLISNGTYTASKNITFGMLERHYNTKNGNNAMLIDLTSQTDRTLSFAGFRPHNSIASTSMTNWFKGGTYNFAGKGIYFDRNTAGSWANASNQRIAVTDGATLTNILNMTLYGTSSTGSGVWIDGDGSRLYNDGTLLLSGYGPAAAAELRISGGGCYSGKKTVLLTDGIASETRKSGIYFTTNHLIVTGSGSRFLGQASSSANGAIHTGGNGDYILVTDNAYFYGKVFLGTGNLHCTNTWMRVEKGARADISELRISAYTVDGVSGNRFEVMDGALVTNGLVYVGGYNNSNNPKGTPGCTLLVSNATYVVSALFMGSGPDGSNSTVVVSGADAEFKHVPDQASHYTFFQGAEHCLFRVENGATVPWPYLSALSYGSSVSNCAIQVATGGRLWRDGAFHTGSERQYNCAGNRIEVTDGGIFDVSKQFALSGDSCALVVSNGTVVSGSFLAGSESPEGTIATNALVLLQGSTPKLNVTNGTFRVQRGSCVRYELNGAMATGYIPLEVSGAATWADGCALEIANAAEAVEAAKRTKSGPVALLSAASITIPSDVLAAAQAQVGDAAVLAVRSVGNKAVLQLRYATGLVVTVR